MKVAVVGTGVSGLVAAYLIGRRHQVTVFEANDYIGGHTNTITVDDPEGPLSVDTGFIVYNERTYPNFTKLLRRLDVASQASDMSFGVCCEATGLEYGSNGPGGLFAQRRNLWRADFHRMLVDIVRFNRQLRRLLAKGDESLDLSEVLSRGGYGRLFGSHFIVPMAAAIWSANPAHIHRFPALTFARFFRNHGFLDLYDRPRWRTVSGGSNRYVKALTADFCNRIHLGTPVTAVRRRPERVEVDSRLGTLTFDRVVMATHSDQTLALLEDATRTEKELLGAIRYQPNEAVLHTDARLMPTRRKAWASWNYRLPRRSRRAATLTYWMNNLQRLTRSTPYLVTLNGSDGIDPARILRRIQYHHPVFDHGAIRAQRRHAELDGQNRTHFCGAYWGYGFHEDGVNSGLAVARWFGEKL
jgi:predicted NAD/FAD-binding protein